MQSRRSFLKMNVQLLAQGYLCYAGLRAGAFSTKDRPLFAAWVEELEQIAADLRGGKTVPLEWQRAMEGLYQKVPFEVLSQALDFDALLKASQPETLLGNIVKVNFPGFPQAGKRLGYGHKMFVMKRGGAIIPHAHNDMVSAHLVIRGAFRVRTYHRRFDLEEASGFIPLEPATDRIFKTGEVLTMSDDAHNVHWLVAQTNQAATFDIPIANLGSERRYAHEANSYSMIFLDPLSEKGGDGVIRAKILTFEDAAARFAP